MSDNMGYSRELFGAQFACNIFLLVDTHHAIITVVQSFTFNSIYKQISEYSSVLLLNCIIQAVFPLSHSLQKGFEDKQLGEKISNSLGG